nr:translation initiation factor eIF-2B subunit gamma [Ipomoea batatas]GMD01257.1 translation initiation factor eIF-2B subunit gamma [Ipomoea batatas]
MITTARCSFLVIITSQKFFFFLNCLRDEEVRVFNFLVTNDIVLTKWTDDFKVRYLENIIVLCLNEFRARNAQGIIFNHYSCTLRYSFCKINTFFLFHFPFLFVCLVTEFSGHNGLVRILSRRLLQKSHLIVVCSLHMTVLVGAWISITNRHFHVVSSILLYNKFSTCSISSVKSGSSSKKPARYNIVGLDPTKQFLLHIASGFEVEKDMRVQKSILRAVGQMDIRPDLMDAHMYAFKRTALQEVLTLKPSFLSLKCDVLPYLVRSQLRSELSLNGVQAEENGNCKDASQNGTVLLAQLMANASTQSFHDLYTLGPEGSAPASRKTHKCCVYIANNSNYCMRLNSIQAFSDINRDVIGDASHLSGYSFSAQNNIIHPSSVLGSKTTVGPHCMLGEGSEMGDKCSVKKSIIGRHCRIGSNVKVVNSVVMNHVTIGDGCSIQGSVICSNVQLQERVVLRDCQVGAGFVVTAGSEYKGESLAKKEKQ